ncbi:MAG: 50S ribosomal protein L21e [Candidatus Nanohaloarchaea archaeon]
MAQKSHGSQQGARKKLARDSRTSTTVNDHMKEFEEGEKALIKFDPSVQDGRVHTRFYGQTAEVTGSRGDAVEVEVKDGGKTKTLFLKPIHLEKVGEE